MRSKNCRNCSLALGIDDKAIARTPPLVLRDMEPVYASRQHKRQCDHEIAAGTSGQHYEEYCGNAATINSLARRHNSQNICPMAWDRKLKISRATYPNVPCASALRDHCE